MAKKSDNKKGISPVIATVLLIALVVVIAGIIFLWFTNINEEIITKFGDENIKLACAKVSFDASYSDNVVYVSNTGTVPINSLKYKAVSSGEHSENVLSDSALATGEAGEFPLDASGYDKIVLIPVLLGNSEEGQRTFKCDEKEGYEVLI